jgi:cyclin A
MDSPLYNLTELYDEMDIDMESNNNLVLKVFREGPWGEYSNEIYLDLIEREKLYRPDPNYLTQIQTDINSAMRCICIDWLCEVSQEYKLQKETLFFAVNLLDRYLSIKKVSRSKLQLVAITIIYIAAKYFELITPNVDDYVYVTDDTFNREQIILMELEILISLDYKLFIITIPDFLDCFIEFIKDSRLKNLSYYIAELSLLSYEMIEFIPSVVSASSLWIALKTLKIKFFENEFQRQTGYTFNEMEKCIKILFCFYKKDQKTTVKEKYEILKYDSVSLIKPPNELK